MSATELWRAVLNPSSPRYLEWRKVFDTDEVPPAVGNVEVLMAWPFFLNGNCQLRLVMRGKIARVAGNSIAVRATSYDFRTGTVQCARTAP